MNKTMVYKNVIYAGWIRKILEIFEKHFILCWSLYMVVELCIIIPNLTTLIVYIMFDRFEGVQGDPTPPPTKEKITELR